MGLWLIVSSYDLIVICLYLFLWFVVVNCILLYIIYILWFCMIYMATCSNFFLPVPGSFLARNMLQWSKRRRHIVSHGFFGPLRISVSKLQYPKPWLVKTDIFIEFHRFINIWMFNFFRMMIASSGTWWPQLLPSVRTNDCRKSWMKLNES